MPGTLPLPPGFEAAPQVLAFGGQMKAAICLTKNGQAMLSHHLGDLDDALTAAEYETAITDCTALFAHRAKLGACDLHPGYRATARAEASDLPLVRVQHHHAHLAACLAENLWPLDGGPVAGLVLDGTGLGEDGTIWGGEVLLGDYRSFTRRAWLMPAPLPGGDRAAREPWRNAVMRLDQAGLPDWADALFPDKPRDLLRQAAAGGLNAPLSSSAGRLFDAVAAVLSLCPDRQSYEGEAAMRLEALAGRTPAAGAPFAFGREGGALDPRPLFHDLREAVRLGRAEQAPGLFHAALARAFAEEARALVLRGEAAAVALSGGCFQNAVLLRETLRWLGDVPVLTHRQTPANDGGLALGQAMVAAARHIPAAEAG
jgi:hydrogenase maturation protein HypF